MSLLWKVSGKRLSLIEKEGQAAIRFVTRPGGWMVAEFPDGRRERFILSESKGKLSVSLRGHLWHGELLSERKGAGAQSGGGDADLIAQFPGKVRKILVQSGAQVKEGEPLLLLEAMKMEFSIKAPFAGKVTRVLVQEGQQLSPGTKLVDLEPSPGNSK